MAKEPYFVDFLRDPDEPSGGDNLEKNNIGLADSKTKESADLEYRILCI